MKGKTIFLWQSEERQLERLTGYQQQSIFDEEIEQMAGTRVTIMLRSGEKINAILIFTGSCILGLRSIFPETDLPADLVLVPKKQIAVVSVD